MYVTVRVVAAPQLQANTVYSAENKKPGMMRQATWKGTRRPEVGRILFLKIAVYARQIFQFKSTDI